MLKRRGCSLAVTACLRVAASPSAVTTSGFHSPHRLHVHCLQARPPEAGFVSTLLLREAPACGAPGRKTSCSQCLVSSQRDRTGRALGIVAWLRGLPARQVLVGAGLGGNRVWPVSTRGALVWGFHLPVSTAPAASWRQRTRQQPPRTLRKGDTWHVLRFQHRPSADLWGHVWPTHHLVFKHFYICGSS